MRRVLLFVPALIALAGLLLGQAAPASPHSAVFSRFAVASDHALASEAGSSVLEAGGNAADAAAATMLALGVVSPSSSGLGGGGFALYYRASDRSVTFLDFRETAPAAASAAMFQRAEGASEPSSTTGGLAVAVPGEPAGIEELLRRFGSGSVSREAIAAPAIRLAREGFPASHYVSRYSAFMESSMRADTLLSSWLPERGGIREGTVLRNPALADTLTAFARQGARGFYRGRVGAAIVAAVRARGGILSARDLAGYRVRERAPLEATFFGRRWVSAPPPSAGGYTMLHSLGLLEQWRPQLGEPLRDGALLRHALAESWIGGFDDRRRYFGDPDHVDVPLDALMQPARLARRAAHFAPTHHQPAARWALPLEIPEPQVAREGVESGTSHLCIVDAEGNVAAITTTVNLPFGSRVTAAGVVLNDEMDDFASEIGVPNDLGVVGGAPNLPGPGRRPISSMSPTIVFDGDLPALCVGASGGARIITATEQVAVFTLLVGDPVADAIARPRVHHGGAPDALLHEPGLPAGMRMTLWARRHQLTEVESSAVVQAIHIVRREGAVELHAASDPRKRGEPRGR